MIRTAGPEDAEVLLSIHRRTRATAYAHLGTPEEAAGKGTVENFRIQLETGQGFLFERDGEPIGFAMLQGDLLRELYVLPEAQGTGAGKVLLRAAVEHGARALWVYVDNPGSRAFYERHGWVGQPETAYVDPAWAVQAPAMRYVLGAAA